MSDVAEERPRTAAEIAADEARAEHGEHGSDLPDDDHDERDETEAAGAAGGRPSEHLTGLATAAREAREAGDGDVLVVEDATLEARERAAQNTADDDDWSAVTEWLLGDTVEAITRKLKVRVGGSDQEPRMIPWIIKAIPIDVIRSAERDATGGGNRAQRRAGGAGQYDDLKANLRVIVEGTVKPDLKAIATEHGIRDPTTLLQRRLALRVGVIARIAGEIMSLSGFDESDVQAAGN